MDLNKAIDTQKENIQKKTGKSLDELFAILASTGFTKHGELRDYAKEHLGLGHGDANALALHFLEKDAPEAAANPLDDIYVGPKAGLRPIHEKLMATIDGFGEFEVHPKKGYVALRRKKQFAMIGPATNSRVEVGINMKGIPGTDRLMEQPAGGMCQYKVKVENPEQVDDELFAWIKTAYDAAG